MTPRVGEDFVESKPCYAGDDMTLGVVDLSIFPHHPDLPDNSMAGAERWAAGIGVPANAIDDVVDGAVEVVAEGNWRFFAR